MVVSAVKPTPSQNSQVEAMPRRCPVTGCSKRPIYGFPNVLEDKARKDCTNSTDAFRWKNSASNCVAVDCNDEEETGRRELLSECAYDEFLMGCPIEKEKLGQQMEDPHSVVYPVQSHTRYLDTDDFLMDKAIPPSLALAHNVSSSTLSSVSSCTTGRSTPPLPSDVLIVTKRSKQACSVQSMIFCKFHQMPGMVDVVSRRCEWKGGCTKRPLYGYPGERASVCASHETENMIDRKSRYMELPLFLPLVCIYDITLQSPCPLLLHTQTDRRCLAIDCNTVPSYAFPGVKASYCAKHSKPGMLNVVSSRCIFPQCQTRASFAKSR